MPKPFFITRREASKLRMTYPGLIIKPALNTAGPLVNGMLLNFGKRQRPFSNYFRAALYARKPFFPWLERG